MVNWERAAVRAHESQSVRKHGAVRVLTADSIEDSRADRQSRNGSDSEANRMRTVFRGVRSTKTACGCESDGVSCTRKQVASKGQCLGLTF